MFITKTLTNVIYTTSNQRWSIKDLFNLKKKAYIIMYILVKFRFEKHKIL